MNGTYAEEQEHLEERLAAECRALLAMLWAGYTRAEAEEALLAQQRHREGVIRGPEPCGPGRKRQG